MRIMSGGPCLHWDCSNRNSFGYCRTTACINEHYQQEQRGLPLTTNKSESVVKQPKQTNADRIRAMTNEELSELFEMIPHLRNPSTYNMDGFCIDNGLRTKSQWLDWLKQEAE